MRNTFSGVWNVHVLASLHTGKARVWHAAGVRPVTCDWLERAAVLEDAGLVWRGSDVSTFQQGLLLEYSSISHHMILDRIPAVPDVQSAWLILLHCTQARANCLLRVVRPDAARAFAQNHDEGLFQRLCRILQIEPTQCVPEARETATLSLMLSGLGLRSAERTRGFAFCVQFMVRCNGE